MRDMLWALLGAQSWIACCSQVFCRKVGPTILTPVLHEKEMTHIQKREMIAASMHNAAKPTSMHPALHVKHRIRHTGVTVKCAESPAQGNFPSLNRPP